MADRPPIHPADDELPDWLAGRIGDIRRVQASLHGHHLTAEQADAVYAAIDQLLLATQTTDVRLRPCAIADCDEPRTGRSMFCAGHRLPDPIGDAG